MQQATHVGSCVEASSDAGSIPAASTRLAIKEEVWYLPFLVYACFGLTSNRNLSEDVSAGSLPLYNRIPGR